jgi:nucleoid-associated protein YgaU
VRADLLGPRAEVLARAAVPFEREPGEAIAAVASDQPAAEEAQAAAEAESAGQKPAAEQSAAEETVPAAQQSGASAQAKPADGSAGAQMAVADETKVEPETATDGATGNETATVDGSSSQPMASGATIERPVETASAEQETGTSAAADAQEITAPKLKSVAGAVIIRRGDTLWRISRRVYGRGVRYTTIYLANQDQIEDPDRIWPGQVFSVPGKTGAGEEADMSAVADRMVPVE